MAGAVNILVTGAAGLIGWHCAARLHAANCAARYRGEAEPYALTLLDRAGFADDEQLFHAVERADAILHFAGVNRGSDEEVGNGNPAIAERLSQMLAATGSKAHIVYANSTHADGDSLYGRSKAKAAAILREGAASFTDLVLPHIFGECARPYYNNVTATLIDQLWQGETPTIHEGASVSLLHAGAAADLAIAAIADRPETLRPEGRSISVAELFDKLQGFHKFYQSNIFPDLADPFDVALFNTYRTGGYPSHYPLPLQVHEDTRGALFESAKAKGQSQTFLSTTHPGQKRGDHFHLNLVERFLVVSGKATIRIRRVLTDEVHRFDVSGDQPVAIDMPPLHTHHIVNEGDEPVITFFWSNRLFDPTDPDTFADPV